MPFSVTSKFGYGYSERGGGINNGCEGYEGGEEVEEKGWRVEA